MKNVYKIGLEMILCFLLITIFSGANLNAQKSNRLQGTANVPISPSEMKSVDIEKIDNQLKWLMPNSELTAEQCKVSADEYWKNHKQGKGSGWKPYKRTEEYWKLRTGDAKNMPNLTNLYNELMNKPISKKNETQVENEWKLLGPSTQPSYSSNQDPTGLGRVNCLTFDPNNPNIIWAGAAFGGVWKTTNAGGEWKTFPFTQFLSIGISDIAVANSSSTFNPIVYAATGDANAAFGGISCYSIGVIKTTDNGETWAPTNFSHQISDRVLINRLLVHPNNPDHVYAATTRGLFVTEDGGVTWDTLTNAYCRDLEFKPNDPNRLWAAFLYNDGTNTLYGLYKVAVFPKEGKDSILFFGTPVRMVYGDVIRMAITVNDDHPDYIYALSATNGGGLHSVIYSPDGNEQWFYMAQTVDNKVGNFTPDLLNVKVDQPDSIDTPSQGFYDLCIAANPKDPMDVFIGGVNICRYRAATRTWVLSAYWTTKYVKEGVPYVHADHHDLKFSRDGVLFSANDGGVFRYFKDVNVWEDVSEGLEISQFYRISGSRNDAGIIIGGTQDNGTSLFRYNNWIYKRGGDGMDCQIDPFTDQVMYNSIYYGDFMVSRDGGDTWSKLVDTTITKEKAAWVAPFVIDPVIPDILYVGYQNVWKATRKGQDPFQKISNFADPDPIRHIAVSRADNKVIYVIKPKGVWLTTDGGTTWKSIVTGDGDIAMTTIAINPKDPLHIWMSRGAFVAGEKVFEYKKGLSHYSTGLPNVPANIIVHNRNSNNNQLFLGTDVGVFFKDDDMKQWEPYGVGLPNVVVQDLDIHNTSGKLRAATFGRGLWEVKIVDCTIDAPTLQFSRSNKLCEGDTLVLSVDKNYASYLWSTGATSKSITVTEAGLFNVTVKDERNCVAVSADITVSKIIPPDVKVKSFSGATAFCQGDSIRLDASPALNFDTFEWSNGDIGKTIYAKESGTYTATGITREGCKKTSQGIVVSQLPPPAKPTITVEVDKLTCSEANSYEWYLNGKKLLYTSRTITAKSNGYYSVLITNEQNCKNISDEVYVEVTDVEEFINDKDLFTVQPNPAEDKLFVNFDKFPKNSIEIIISDLLGNILKRYTISEVNQNLEFDISNLSSGIYFININIGSEKYLRKFVKQ